MAVLLCGLAVQTLVLVGLLSVPLPVVLSARFRLHFAVFVDGALCCVGQDARPLVCWGRCPRTGWVGLLLHRLMFRWCVDGEAGVACRAVLLWWRCVVCVVVGVCQGYVCR